MIGLLHRTTACAVVVLLARLSSTLAVECNSATHVVITAQDAHNYAKCDVVIGDILFEPTTADLSIDDLPQVNGTANCTSVPSLITFSWPGAFAVWKDLVFVDLPNVTEINMSEIVDIWGDFSVEGLPRLENLDLTNLIHGRGFRMVDLPSLQSFILNPRIFTLQGGDVYIYNVSVTSLDSVFNHSGRADSVYVDHIPNVNSLIFKLPEVQNFNITGNGNLAIQWAGARVYNKMEAGTVAISGVVDFSRNKTSWWNSTVDKFYATRNQFATLPLDFDHMRSLYIGDNENLTTLSFHKNWPEYEWEEIAITGNPLLNLISGTADSASFKQNMTKTWIWPRKDVSSMVFEGPFTNEFFEPFINYKPDTGNTSRPKVLSRFEVNSSLNFSCTGLDELRSRGVLRGEYYCQGHTLPEGSGAFITPLWGCSWISAAAVLVVVLYF